MADSPKKLSQDLMIKNRLSSKPNLQTLNKLIEDSGFTIIEYNKYNNSADITELIKKLRIEEKISIENSFIYVKGNIKFVFINSDLKESDKSILLCHELGHIYDQRLDAANHLYSKIDREDFANKFAHYLEHPSLLTKIISAFLRRKLAWILILVLLIISVSTIYIGCNLYAIDAFLPYKSNALTDSYYVTATGIRYHKDFCKHVRYRINTSQMTMTEAISKGYTPCLDCIGEE